MPQIFVGIHEWTLVANQSFCYKLTLKLHEMRSAEIQKLHKVLEIHPEAVNFCCLLNKSGYQAYFVGGSVRDTLFGKKPTDIDLATDALPAQVKELAIRNNIIHSMQDKIYGAVKLKTGYSPVVVTTFRQDLYDGKKLSVTFTDSIDDDVQRRDFTINAIYVDLTGSIQDPLNGVEDAKCGIVRFIGDPKIRIREDVFRILRFFRCRAWFGSQNQSINSKIVAAMRQYAEQLNLISQERIGGEMRKLLKAKSIFSVLTEMQNFGVLQYCLPNSNINLIATLESYEQRFGIDADYLCRLAVLVNGKPIDSLRLNKTERQRLKRLQYWIKRAASLPELAYRLGKAEATHVILSRATIYEEEPVPDFQQTLNHWVEEKFPITAYDLIDKYQGAGLGRILKQLEQKWIDSKFALNRDQLIDLIKH